jgi:hypothetical protein
MTSNTQAETSIANVAVLVRDYLLNSERAESREDAKALREATVETLSQPGKSRWDWRNLESHCPKGMPLSHFEERLRHHILERWQGRLVFRKGCWILAPAALEVLAWCVLGCESYLQHHLRASLPYWIPLLSICEHVQHTLPEHIESLLQCLHHRQLQAVAVERRPIPTELAMLCYNALRAQTVPHTRLKWRVHGGAGITHLSLAQLRQVEVHCHQSEEAVQAQLEWWFSDDNLAKSKKWRRLLGEHEDGGVAISDILCCGRLVMLGVDGSQVRKAVEKSPFLQLDSNDGNVIHAVVPLTEKEKEIEREGNGNGNENENPLVAPVPVMECNKAESHVNLNRERQWYPAQDRSVWQPGTFTVGSWNVCADYLHCSPWRPAPSFLHQWSHRFPAMCAEIDRRQPQILCLQEIQACRVPLEHASDACHNSNLRSNQNSTNRNRNHGHSHDNHATAWSEMLRAQGYHSLLGLKCSEHHRSCGSGSNKRKQPYCTGVLLAWKHAAFSAVTTKLLYLPTVLEDYVREYCQGTSALNDLLTYSKDAMGFHHFPLVMLRQKGGNHNHNRDSHDKNDDSDSSVRQVAVLGFHGVSCNSHNVHRRSQLRVLHLAALLWWIERAWHCARDNIPLIIAGDFNDPYPQGRCPQLLRGCSCPLSLADQTSWSLQLHAINQSSPSSSSPENIAIWHCAYAQPAAAHLHTTVFASDDQFLGILDAIWHQGPQISCISVLGESQLQAAIIEECGKQEGEAGLQWRGHFGWPNRHRFSDHLFLMAQYQWKTAIEAEDKRH